MLRDALWYIEENLKADIALEELATRAGISLFYFLRVFCENTGSPVRQYIVRRRLAHAASEIASGAKAVDVALAYGFDTHAGFYKAFRRLYGCSPSRYRKLAKLAEPSVQNLAKGIDYHMQQQDIQALLKNWALEPEMEISAVYPTVFDVKSDENWFVGDSLQLVSGTSTDQLERHLALSEALAQEGYLAATAIQAADGKPYIVRDGRYFCLKKSIFGNGIPNEKHFEGNYLARANSYGRGIAKLHHALSKLESSQQFDEISFASDAANWSLPKAKGVMAAWDMPLAESFCTAYLANFAGIEAKLPRQLIHRDLHAGNIILDEADTVIGFDAFDASVIGPRLFDPCYCATSILSGCIDDPKKCELWFDVLRAILKGYDEITPLSQEEKEAVPYIIWTIQFLFVACFSDPGNKYHQVGAANRKMLKYLIENQDRYQSI